MDGKVPENADGAAAGPATGGLPAPAPGAPARKRKYAKPGDGLFWRGIIARMDPKLKRQLDIKLRFHSFRSYRALAQWLAERGCSISHQALWKYGKYFDRMLDALKIATAQAKIIVKETRCDN